MICIIGLKIGLDMKFQHLMILEIRKEEEINSNGVEK